MAVIEVDWGAVGAVGIFVVLPPLATIARSIRARGSVARRYRQEKPKARAALEGDSLIPSLASLVADVSAEISPDVLLNADGDPDATALAVERLQRIDYMERLADLNRLAGDFREFDALPEDAVRWVHRLGKACAVILLGILYPALWICTKGMKFSTPWLVVSGAVAVAGVTAAVFCWLQETATHNRLETLISEYGG